MKKDNIPSPEEANIRQNIYFANLIRDTLFPANNKLFSAMLTDPVSPSLNCWWMGQEGDIWGEYLKNHPKNIQKLPEGLSLPAISIDLNLSSRSWHMKDTLTATYSYTDDNKVYITYTTYWLDFQGNAKKVIKTLYDELNVPDEGIVRVENITEGIFKGELESGDYEFIEGRMSQVKAGEYSHPTYE